MIAGPVLHDASERVNFPNQMTFANSANGRVAGHLADEIQIQRKQGGAGPEPGRRGRGFTPCMPSADHDDVKLFVENHCRFFVELVFLTSRYKT